MKKPKPDNAPTIFLVLLRDLASWWESSQITGIVIGGIAASLLGRPRATRDLDVLVMLDMDQWLPSWKFQILKPTRKSSCVVMRIISHKDRSV